MHWRRSFLRTLGVLGYKDVAVYIYEDAPPLLAFYASRWWRLAPLFVVVQLLCAISWIVSDAANWPVAISDYRWWFTQVTVLGSTQFGRILPPAWSLDVESQFYLVAPWFAMLIGSVPLLGGSNTNEFAS